MEVLQQMEASSTLQSHITQSTVHPDNPTAQALTTTTDHHNNSTTDSQQLEDITEHTLLELQHLDHVPAVTSESTSLDDILLGSDSIATSNNTQPVVSTALTSHVSASNGTEPPQLNYVTANNSPPNVKVESNAVSSDFAEDPTNAVESVEESPQVNVAINNVVCTFSTRCHLNLRHIALNGENVELKKAQGMLNMKLRNPSATASIWSSGKITITGANSESNCKIAARKIARKVQKIGFDVSNSLSTCYFWIDSCVSIIYISIDCEFIT